MADLSTTGFALRVVASNTFPQGFTVTAFASDSDPWDSPSLDVATVEMDLNGNMNSWSTPVPMTRNVGLTPGTEDERNMRALYEANRVGRDKRSARDEITIVATWPDGSTETMGGGKIINGPSGNSTTQAARMKSVTYGFAFETYSSTGPTQ